MEGLFAGTPPLEGFRFLFHEAATVRSGEPIGSKALMINDVSRAFFEAPATRNICVEIPSEVKTYVDVRHDRVGHLRMSLYGTRDASTNWQEEVAREMKKLGFTRGRYNPCLYFHKERNLRTFLHGDDFAIVGTLENVTWLKVKLEGRFEIKTQCISPSVAPDGSRLRGAPRGPCIETTNGKGIKEGSEARLLNRVVRCTADG